MRLIGNIVDDVTNMIGVGAETAAGIRHYFEAMQLPVPTYKPPYKVLDHTDTFIESVPTHDNGYLVFLKPYGCVLRISLNDEHKVKFTPHPYQIQPIGTRFYDPFRIDLFPGVNTPVPFLLHERVSAFFDRHSASVRLDDQSMDNLGLLPVGNEKFPCGIPVVIDPGSILSFTPSKITLGDEVGLDITMEDIKSVSDDLRDTDYFAGQALRILPPEITSDQAQDFLYGSLVRAFHKMWPTDCDDPNSGLVKKFWQVCRDMEEDGCLLTSWDCDDNVWLLRGKKTPKFVRIASTNYAQRLEEQHALS